MLKTKMFVIVHTYVRRYVHQNIESVTFGSFGWLVSRSLSSSEMSESKCLVGLKCECVCVSIIINKASALSAAKSPDDSYISST